MSLTHLLNREGATVCGASPRPDGINVTSDGSLADCVDCLNPKTCTHARDRSEAELDLLRSPKPGKMARVSFCGKPATEWLLPDGNTGNYCEAHGPRVLARCQRRLDLKAAAS